MQRFCMTFWKKISFRSSARLVWMMNTILYNINADDAACAIARAMKAEKLAFLTDIEGVYKDPEDPTTLISELEVKEAQGIDC